MRSQRSRDAMGRTAVAAPTRHGGPLLDAARRGDAAAFERLIAPFERELHVHCYRMLGTVHDADDAMQETWLRAWRGIPRFEPRRPLGAWLYRISTNVCLTELHDRARRPRVSRHPLDEPAGLADDGTTPIRLEPYPDRRLDLRVAAPPTPEGAAELRESVELAFLVALQTLPPRQRAVLLLRDVLGLPAAQVAELMDSTVAAVNSALQRARSTFETERQAGRISKIHVPHPAGVEASLVRRFSLAWGAADQSALASLLVEDALLTMPPAQLRVVGRDAITSFLLDVPVPRGDHPDGFRTLAASANGQPALAVYLRDERTGDQVPHALLVFSLRSGLISSVTRFEVAELFDRFGLPPRG
jgi:RNA polymerase sigma-70 factor (TIGR02960 family)